MRGGSFLSMVYPLESAGLSQDAVLVTLSVVDSRAKKFGHVFSFPFYPDYAHLGVMMASNPAMSILYHLPLYALASWVSIIYRPKLIISNGLQTAIPVIVLAKMFGRSVILSYHGQLKFYIQPSVLKVVRRIVTRLVDYGVANSEGSKKDLSALLPQDRILVLEHIVPPVFFKPRDRKGLRQKYGIGNEFVVFYSGWLTREKRCDRLIELASHTQDPNIVFLFAGDGELRNVVLELCRGQTNVKYLGYIRNEDILAEYYTIADVSWSIADTTYVARSGAEALACGTPIVVPNTPGVLKKAEAGIKIPNNLIPATVGWVIVDDDLDGMKHFLVDLCTTRRTDAMREYCREFAIRHHSDLAASDLISLIEASSR
jgi:glycosyltransferase involved in cell wall biosynthesis